MIRFASPLSRRLAQDEGGYHRFGVDEKLWCKEVAGEARFAEQARNGRNEEEMNRTADLRMSQVSAFEVRDLGAGRCDSGLAGREQHRDQRK